MAVGDVALTLKTTDLYIVPVTRDINRWSVGTMNVSDQDDTNYTGYIQVSLQRDNSIKEVPVPKLDPEKTYLITFTETDRVL